MRKLNLKGKHNSSAILIGRGILTQAGELCKAELAERKAPSAICVITDTNVAELYLETVLKEFEAFSIPVYSHVIPAGEENKNLDTVSKIYDTLSTNRFGRDDMIVALGGGVTGDIAGFTAATYLRGMRHLIQIPTTLLAQVDSSVGGKTGVDLPLGKNLVGAFRQPDVVLIDPVVLDSLPKEIFTSGMAEVIKYGCIWDEEILELAAKETAIDTSDPKETADLSRDVNWEKEKIESLIARCVAIKIRVVEEDETEEGLRRILNFGHTIGHGLEKLANFTGLSHGEAVAIGMVAATQLGEAAGITDKGCYDKLKNLLQCYELPVALPYPVEEIYQAMMTDKKKQGGSLYFIFVERFGKTDVRKLPVEELRQMMKVLGD
ncbi:3-dehydroquinate synthase [Anoxybacterium hadale]|uniref:3-dehydroquinate synthase n=2 Tax=Anoxybacterium hadale TaxID=3408580 RepID=A0ACD1AH14_9FIRM|nr:3-dehydroquinate synthase [Clostridiales bacterium]